MTADELRWLVPEYFTAKVREVLGGIDMDLSSPTLETLAKPWHGQLFLQPVQSRGATMRFVERLVSEIKAGNVTEAVMLTHNNTDTAWFHLAANSSAALCFPRGRIKFIRSDGIARQPAQGQAFFYFGRRRERFAEVFVQVGFILGMKRWRAEAAALQARLDRSRQLLAAAGGR